MKRCVVYVFFASLMVIVGYSCFSSKKTQSDISKEETEVKRQTIVPDTFVLPDIPEIITGPDERAGYLVMHYWDRFDFTNRELIKRPEITEQAFVDYIDILNYVPLRNAEQSLAYTLNNARVDSTMYFHFVSLFEKYFYEPNSPFRNEEFYIPVLKEVMESPLFSEETRSRYRFQLDMTLKNRVGDKAGDFTYTLASGVSSNLYSIRSEYLLLMFSNPGCSTCAAVTDRLNRSEQLNAAMAMNSPTRTMLTIMTLYPENNPDGWLAHLPELPAGWIHGYDKGMEISKKRLYDIKAIPTLYLLDRDKRVVLKDTSIEAIEDFFSKPI